MSHDLLKRTPVRLAATFTALFLTTAVILSAFLYVQLGIEMSNQIRHRVEETLDELIRIEASDGDDDLAKMVDSEAASLREGDTIFLLVDRQGKFRAGNVRDIVQTTQWLTLRRADLVFVSDRGRPDDLFFAKWRPVSSGAVLVGISDREIRATRRLMLRGLGWGLVATLGLAALCGAFLARRAQVRIDRISNTLEAVSQGKLDARVPISGSHDDVDHVGEQINRTLVHLKSLVENVNQQSSDIAHDLKKPIGRLQQNLDQARRTAKDTAEFQRAIEAALRDLDSIVETFEALLNITQIEAGARKARFRDIDLTQVVADVRDVYEAVAEDNGCTLSDASDPMERAIVRGDKELLVQLLANLIENAIRHCPPRTQITIGLKQADDAYALIVTDDGPGIPTNERQNVLRRFYRLERARSTPGNGLGLSLVAAISDLHNARLALEDNGPGLKVTVTIPALDA